MNPSAKNLIIQSIARVQMNTGGPVHPDQLRNRIPFNDPGRECRRLYESGDLKRTPDGRYYILEKPRSLELWNW